MTSVLSIVFFLLPLVVFAFLARRFVSVFVQLRDPEGFARTFSAKIEAGLRQAGLDPAEFQFQSAQDLEDLPPEAVAVVRNVVMRAMIGFGSGKSSATGEPPILDWASAPSLGSPPAGGSRSATSGGALPPPIDQASRNRSLLWFVLVVLIAVGGALYAMQQAA